MKSVLSKMTNYRKIQASSKAKNARYSARREPKIMDIESTTCTVVFKFHIRMDDSGHQREKETVRNIQWLA